MRKAAVPLSCGCAASIFMTAPHPHRPRALRIDDGAGAEDLLLPLSAGHTDAGVGHLLRHCQRDLPHQETPVFTTGWPTRQPSCTVLYGSMAMVTGPLWARKAWGVWWQWDARLTMSLLHVDGVRLVSAASALWRARVRDAGGRPRGVRDGHVAVRLSVGQYLAHDSPADDGCADTARRLRVAALVRISGFLLLYIALMTLRMSIEQQRAMFDQLYLESEE